MKATESASHVMQPLHATDKTEFTDPLTLTEDAFSIPYPRVLFKSFLAHKELVWSEIRDVLNVGNSVTMFV